MTAKVGKTEITIKKKDKSFIARIGGLVVTFALVLVITALIIAMSGKNPIEAFGYLFEGAFSSTYNIGETMVKTIPLLIAGLGLCICYRTGLTSVGAEGQMAIAGLMTIIVGVYVTGLPRLVMIPLCLIFGMIGGGIWAGIAGFLKAKFGISEIINTIMLNYIASFTVSYMCSGPIIEPPGTYIQSSMLQDTAFLTKLVPQTRIHTGIIIAIISIVVVYLLIWKSPLGYQMRAVGYNPSAAKTSGINVTKNLVLAMFLSGAFCGLAGAIEIMGLHHRLMPGFTSELGFDAMAIALLGGLHPVGVTLSALFFGALRAGSTTMQRAMQIPASLVSIIQGLIIIFVMMQGLFSNFIIKISKGKSGKEA